LFIPSRNNCTQLLHHKFILLKQTDSIGSTQEQLGRLTSGNKAKKTKIHKISYL